MFWAEVAWGVSDVSDESPSVKNIIFMSGERINSVLSLGHVTGDPDTSRHYPD
jgi:hypothetical protein